MRARRASARPNARLSCSPTSPVDRARWIWLPPWRCCARAACACWRSGRPTCASWGHGFAEHRGAVDRVIVGGGDGTLNAVAEALVESRAAARHPAARHRERSRPHARLCRSDLAAAAAIIAEGGPGRSISAASTASTSSTSRAWGSARRSRASCGRDQAPLGRARLPVGALARGAQAALVPRRDPLRCQAGAAAALDPDLGSATVATSAAA